MKYRIVSDSSSNVFHIEDIDYRTVPLKVIMNEGEFFDDERTNVERFLSVLKHTKGKTSTSCPNAYEWASSFDGADTIFAVTVTGGLSGCYSAAMQGRSLFLEEHPEANIYVIDSLSVGPEILLIIEKLKELIAQGLSFSEICVAINEYKKHTHLLFNIANLDNLARNGRVSPAIAKLSGLLGIRCVGKASDQGTLEILHKCRGEKKATNKIFEEMITQRYNGKKVHIAHCNNESMANDLKYLILQSFPEAKVNIIPCTIVCAYYVSDQGLIVGFEDSDC